MISGEGFSAKLKLQFNVIWQCFHGLFKFSIFILPSHCLNFLA